MSDPSPSKSKAAPEAEGEEENERPTFKPPFDVEEFARETTARGSPPEPAAVTRPPPAPPAFPEIDEGFASGRDSERPTLTNREEIEAARERSSHTGETPRSRPSVLSMANARVATIPPLPASPPRNLSPSSIEAAVLGAIGTSPADADGGGRDVQDYVAEMRDRFSLGDYTGALEMAEAILSREPSNLEAAECGENCRTVLENLYAGRVGPLTRVPMVIVPPTQIRWLSMDHRAGFVLSLIDGSSTVEMLLDVSGMAKIDALRILSELVQQKIVGFR
jgi:hypothetical protein